MSIGKRIKNRREALGMSQEELATKLGYKSRSSINKIELEINDVTQSKIAQIAKALGTTPAYIMGWEEEPSAKKNDALADIILKARRDEDLIELIKELCDLSPEHRQSVKAFLTLLKQQNVDNMK
ncbi:MAG: helix-turn-helix transcriptional regulator [Clostridia bacterium]|nr:helix-turn-helix transcriptional regulator [Clostridia bacterium]